MELLSRRVSRVFDRTQEDIPIITIERAALVDSTAANDHDYNDDDDDDEVVLQRARPVLGWVSSRQDVNNDDDDDDDEASCRDPLMKSQLLVPTSPR